MFFFAADEGVVVRSRLRSTLGWSGEIRMLRKDAALLLWTEDAFTRFGKRGALVRVAVGGSRSDGQAACTLEWHLDSGKVTVRRRWSGEFTAYVAREPTWAIASHLRLISGAFGSRPPGTVRVKAGWSVSMNSSNPLAKLRWGHEGRFRSTASQDYRSTVARARRLVRTSVGTQDGPIALLLSGGLDSSVIAAVAKTLGKRIHAFVFALRRPIQPQDEAKNDLEHARRVAAHLRIPCTEILLDSRTVVRNAPLAVALGETPRGTIVDPCAAFIEVARTVRKAGYTRVLIGEAADDIFGGLDFALRYYRGRELKEHFRRELTVGLPDEEAILQKIFEPWGVLLVDPFLTQDLMSLAYNLPLRFRVDPKRRMKRVLRDAFADILPPEIVDRPKGVTRDTTQVRFAMEKHFGRSRNRYRAAFKSLFGPRSKWPGKLAPLLKKSLMP